MCGRFVITTPVPTIAKRFKVTQVVSPDPGPRYNIAPTNEIIVVNDEGVRQLTACRWGFLPVWAKDPAIRTNMINARAETVADKPVFRHAFKKQRCLVIADGFYEWKKERGRKLPMYIRLKTGEPFGFAGLYNVWTSPAGDEVCTCTIITTRANDLLKPIHDRMPVIIPMEREDRWLDPALQDKKELLPLLEPYDADAMEAWEVSPRMNRPGYDSPENIEPV
jgi:putative SOS response-associated peptidase YedK